MRFLLQMLEIVYFCTFTVHIVSAAFASNGSYKHTAATSAYLNPENVLVLSLTEKDNAPAALSRRLFGLQSISQVLGASIGFLGTIPKASAKSTSQEEKDKANLLKGFDRLTYLLENWEKETTICGQTDNPYTGTKGCDRTPLKVMEYLGYKSMDDPLFKAEKTMRRLEPLVPSDKENAFLDALEKWVEAADEASGMAYVSSWGEANPGGGKDRVEYFIERAKKNVVDSRNSLATVIDILKLNS